MSAVHRSIILKSETDTTAVANSFAGFLQIGDVLLLSGPIGAGKSFFSRALIRARTGTTDDIPSPTFTLVQSYPHKDGDVWHCDLYRLSDPDEAVELGLDEAFEAAICLIEWPDRLGSLQPENALSLRFAAMEDHHTLHIDGPAEWQKRLQNLDT